MPSTDKKAGTTPVPSSNQVTQNDEFDLGIVSSAPQVSDEATNPSSEENTVAQTNDSLDFNLDLPDSYADTPTEKAASSEKATEEEKSVESAIPDIDLPQAEAPAQETPVQEAPAQDNSILDIDFPDVSAPQEPSAPIQEAAIQEPSEPVQTESVTPEPIENINTAPTFQEQPQMSVDTVSEQPQFNLNSENTSLPQDEAPAQWGGMFSSIQAADETFIPDQISDNGSSLLFSEAPADANLNSQASPDISLDAQWNSDAIWEPQNGETLSDTLKFQEEVELPSADAAALSETPAAPNPLLEEPMAEEPEGTLNMDALMGEPQEAQTLDLNNFTAQTESPAPQEWVSDWMTAQNPQAEAPAQETAVAQAQEGEQAAAPLNLDEMMTQNTQASAEQQAENVWEIDPFMAMKSTLEGKNVVDFQNGTNQEAKPTLDLNAMPTQQQAAASNPMTSWLLSKLWGVSLKGWSKKATIWIFSVLWIVAAWAIVYIRYPDLFVWWIQTPDTPTPVITYQDPEEHGSAIEQTGSTTQDPEQNEPTETLTWSEEENVEIIEENPGAVPVDGELLAGSDDDILVIDLTDGEESTSIEPTVPSTPKEPEIDPIANPAGPEVLPEGSEIGWEAVDPLAGVEDIVWALNNTDLIKQEAMQYQAKGAELKDQGASANNTTMFKYGTALEWQAKALIDKLEKGENIDISTWTEQKATFDGYIEKANA